MPSYLEEPWVSVEAMQALMSNLAALPCRATVVAAVGGDQDEAVIGAVWRAHPARERVELVDDDVPFPAWRARSAYFFDPGGNIVELKGLARGSAPRVWVGGTGMLLAEEENEVVTVQRVFPNTHAEDAGVSEGDRIVAVGDSAATEWGLGKVSDRLRGPPGSKVMVTFSRPGVIQPIKLTFTRREVHVPAISYSTVISGVGYIPLQTFNENAAEEMEAAVAKLLRQGARGLVLDLRDNGGGIVEQSLAALKAGKHVICEKPLVGSLLSAAAAELERRVLDVRVVLLLERRREAQCREHARFDVADAVDEALRAGRTR